eukprot:GHVS01026490.1.p1 GENE.GHVS01026490.1~~GHVS01026490.1.p1  ORF type:complete len:455 (-),score=121.75 GHVS01026490.1:241-1605(-)
MVEVASSVYAAAPPSPVLPPSAIIKAADASPRISESTQSPFSSPCSSSPTYDHRHFIPPHATAAEAAYRTTNNSGQQQAQQKPQLRRPQLGPQLTAATTTSTTADDQLNVEDEFQRAELVRAAQNNDKQYIEFVMKKTHGESLMDINGVADERSGYSCLHIASAHNSVDVVRCLVNAHHSTITTDVRSATFQHTPLHRAAVKGHLEVATVLLDAGAAIDATTQWGCTALHLAATNGHYEVVEELLTRGAKADTVTQFGSRPLLSATYNLHSKVVSLLLHKGSDINQRNQKGLSALHLAVRQNTYDMILLLLHHGANPTLVDGCGSTPLQTAVAMAASKKVIELLQSVNLSGASGLANSSDSVTVLGDRRELNSKDGLVVGYKDVAVGGVGGVVVSNPAIHHHATTATIELLLPEEEQEEDEEGVVAAVTTSSTASSREGDFIYSRSGGSEDEKK